MVQKWLTSNRSGSWSNSGAAAQGFSYGVTGIPAVSGFIDAVRWYRQSTGSARDPSRIQIWDRGAQQVIWETDVPGDDGAVGWQTKNILTDVPVYSGRDYTVTLWVDPGDIIQWSPYANRGTPDSEWIVPPAAAHTTPNASWGFPVNLYNTVFPNVDMRWSDVGGNGGTDPGDAPTSTEAELPAWLSSVPETNTHEGDLPWLTKLVVDTIAATQDTHTAAIAAIAPAVVGAGGPTLATLAANVATAVGLGAVESAISSLVSGLLGNTGEDDIHTTLQGIATATSTKRSPQDVIAVGGIGWTEIQSTVGSGPFAWTQDADAYTIDIEEVGTNVRQQVVLDGVPIFYMRGFAWWWDGTYTGHRIELNGLHNVVRQPQSRYPGILIDVPEDVEWTIKAWDYTA